MTRSHDRVFFLMAFAVLLCSVVLTPAFGSYADMEGEWLICEKKIEDLQAELKRGRIAEVLSGYSLEYHAAGNKVYLYRRVR